MGEVRKPRISLGKPIFWCSRPLKTIVFPWKTNIFIRKNAKSCDCTKKTIKNQKIIKKTLYCTKKIKNQWFQGSRPGLASLRIPLARRRLSRPGCLAGQTSGGSKTYVFLRKTNVL